MIRLFTERLYKEEGMENISITLQSLLTDLLVFLPRLFVALIILIVGLYLAGLISRLVKKGLAEKKVSSQVIHLLTQLTRWGILLVTVVTSLQQVNFDLTAFVAGLGVIGFALGFAVQDIAQNFIAGVMLLIQQPFEIGDFIEVNGYTGEVLTVDLRATQLKTLDGQDVLIPNGQVFSSPIVNFTHAPERRAEIEVGITYTSDLDKVARVALDAIQQLPFVLKQPKPSVAFHTFGDSSINFTVYYWYNGLELLPPAALDPGVRAIKNAFDLADITIPFPIRTIYFYNENSSK